MKSKTLIKLCSLWALIFCLVYPLNAFAVKKGPFEMLNNPLNKSIPSTNKTGKGKKNQFERFIDQLLNKKNTDKTTEDSKKKNDGTKDRENEAKKTLFKDATYEDFAPQEPADTSILNEKTLER